MEKERVRETERDGLRERERVREKENVCERTRKRREIENFTPFFDYSRKGGLLGNNFVG